MWVESLLDTNIEEIPYFRELEERGKKLGITIGEKRGEKRGEERGKKRGKKRGEERGIAIGITIGKIQAIQEFRGIPVDSEEALGKLSPESLQAKLDQLKALPMGMMPPSNS